MDALELLDPTIVALSALGLCVLALLLILVVMLRQSRLLRRYRLLLNGQTGKDLEALLLAQGEDLQALKQAHSLLERRVDGLATDSLRHVQRVGIVRFNAFPDTGSDLSFAIALLDAQDNGFVLSSLYGRSESRIYAKPIRGGVSTYTLSDEEKQALAIAKGQMG
ncbi:MAG: DUF4446 family protein [Bacillota bacterium]